MSTTTPVSGLVIPTNSDILNAEAAMGQFASSIDTLCIPRFATTAARDLAIVAPTEGQLCVVTLGSEAMLMKHTGSSWVPLENRQWAWKTSNQTFVSTATLVNVTGMSFPVVANARYLFEIYLCIDGTVNGSAADFRMGLSIPAVSGTPIYQGIMLTQTATTRDANVSMTGRNMGATHAIAGTDADPISIQVWGTFLTTAAGTLQLQGAQGVSNAEVITMLANDSFMNIRRIG